MKYVLNPKLSDIILTPKLGFDLETSGLMPYKDIIVVISLSNEKGDTYLLQPSKYAISDLKTFLERITRECLIIGHNLKFDFSFIYYWYGVLPTNFWDTQLASQICRNGIKLPHRHNLAAVLSDYLKIEVIETAYKKYLQKSFIGLSERSTLSSEQLNYAAGDTHYLIELYRLQALHVKELELGAIIRLEIALLPVLTKIEVIGCRIDRDKWLYTARHEWQKLLTEYEDSLDLEIRNLAKNNTRIPKGYLRSRRRETIRVLDIFGGVTQISNENLANINYGSSDQIVKLFDVLGEPIPQVKDDKTGELKNSVGEDALLTYIAEYPRTKMRGFIELLLKYREFGKLISTYGEEFLAKLDGKGYIHTEYTQCFTNTGRLSSKSPNLQNIPSTELEKDGYNIRQYFIPDPDEVWITADMEAAEVRIAADYSGDEMLSDSLMKDLDLHSILSSGSYSIIFGQDVVISKSKEKIKIKDKEFVLQTLRDTHKSVLFAKFYKGGAKRVYEVLAEYINLFNRNGMKIAERISKLVDSKLPRLSAYLSSLIDEARNKGFLRGSKLGRIRYFDKLTVYGDAANFPIQNTNGEAMKIALIRMDRYFTETGYGRILMTVHDEMSVSARKDKAEEVAEMLKKVMADALGWFLGTIPGKSSVSIGENWASK